MIPPDSTTAQPQRPEVETLPTIRKIVSDVVAKSSIRKLDIAKDIHARLASQYTSKPSSKKRIPKLESISASLHQRCADRALTYPYLPELIQFLDQRLSLLNEEVALEALTTIKYLYLYESYARGVYAPYPKCHPLWHKLDWFYFPLPFDSEHRDHKSIWAALAQNGDTPAYKHALLLFDRTRYSTIHTPVRKSESIRLAYIAISNGDYKDAADIATESLSLHQPNSVHFFLAQILTIDVKSHMYLATIPTTYSARINDNSAEYLDMISQIERSRMSLVNKLVCKATAYRGLLRSLSRQELLSPGKNLSLFEECINYATIVKDLRENHNYRPEGLDYDSIARGIIVSSSTIRDLDDADKYLKVSWSAFAQQASDFAQRYPALSSQVQSGKLWRLHQYWHRTSRVMYYVKLASMEAPASKERNEALAEAGKHLHKIIETVESHNMRHSRVTFFQLLGYLRHTARFDLES